MDENNTSKQQRFIDYVTLDVLRDYMHLPLSQAATCLRMSVSNLKKVLF